MKLSRFAFTTLAALIAGNAAGAPVTMSTWLSQRATQPFVIWGGYVGSSSWLPARNIEVGGDMVCFEVEIPSPVGSAEYLPRCYPFASIFEMRDTEGKVSLVMHEKPR